MNTKQRLDVATESAVNNDELLAKFLASINVRPHNTKKLFVVGLVGIIGSGKSYVAGLLAQRTGLYIGNSDVIRRFLNSEGFEGEAPVQQTLQYIAEHSSGYLYQKQVSHIIDADLVKFHDTARRNALNHGALFYLVE